MEILSCALKDIQFHCQKGKLKTEKVKEKAKAKAKASLSNQAFSLTIFHENGTTDSLTRIVVMGLYSKDFPKNSEGYF